MPGIPCANCAIADHYGVMSSLGSRLPLHLRAPSVLVVLAVLALASVTIAYILYANSTDERFTRALADALLQLALLVVVGALVSHLVSLHAEARAAFGRARDGERARLEVEREKRLELLRRLRARISASRSHAG